MIYDWGKWWLWGIEDGEEVVMDDIRWGKMVVMGYRRWGRGSAG